MANSTVDGSVVIDVNMDVSDAEKQLAKLKGKVYDLETELKMKGHEKLGLQKQLEAAKKAYDEFAKAAKVNEAGQLRFATEEDQKKALEMYQEIKDIEAQIDKVNDSIEAGNAKLEATKLVYGEIAQEFGLVENEQKKTPGILDRADEKLSSILDKLQKHRADTIEINKALGDVVDTQTRMIGLAQEASESLKIGFVAAAKIVVERLNDIKGKMVDAVKSAPEKAMEAIKGGLGKVVNLFKSIPAAAKKAFSAVSGAMMSAGKTALSLMQNLNVFHKLFGSMGRSLSRIGGMIKRVFVFSVITSGLRAIRAQISQSLSANAELSASLARLKGSLLTAFQPIYSAVLPALNALINTLTRVIAVVAQFIAALFGTTAKQAQSNAKALNDQAKATTGAGKAAAKAEKQLASFDEINKLTFDNSSGSGGGGGGAAAGMEDMFDLDMEDTVFKSWGEAFDAFLDNILNEGIPKLKEGLGHFAEWLNGFSENLYEMFTFPGVKEKIIQLGEDLALAVNGLVDDINWNQLGMAIGAGIDLAILGLLSFLDKFEGMELGKKLAEFVNGLVSQIDWYAFGQLLWAGFKIGIETLAGFLLGLEIPQLIDAAEQLALGFVQSINETFASVEWTEIGEQLAGLFNVVLMFLFTAISTFEWENIAKDLADCLNSFIENVNWGMLGQMVADLFVGVLTFLYTAIGTFDWAEAIVRLFTAISAFIYRVNWAALAQTMSGNTIMALQGIAHGIQSVNWAKYITDLYTAIKIWFTNVDWFGLAGALTEIVVSMFAATVIAVIALIANIFSDMWTAIKDNFSENGEFTVEGFKQGLLNAITGIGTWIYDHIFTPFINSFKTAFGIHSPSTVMAEMGRYMLDGLFNGLANIGSRVSNFGNSLLNGIKNFFGIHSPSTEFEGLGDYMMMGLYNGVDDGTAPVVTAFSTLFTAVTALCTNSMELMQLSAAAFLTWFTTRFAVEWEKGWYNCYRSANANIRLIMSDIDRLNARLAAIERNITITVNFAGAAALNSLGGSGASPYAARLAAMPALAQTDIPHLARGAVIPPNREFMAVLGDQRKGYNLEGPEDMFRKIVREEMGWNNQTLAILQAILSAIREGKTIEFDRQQFCRIVHKANSEESRRVGVSFAGVKGF